MSQQQLGLPPVRGEDLSEAEATYGFPPGVLCGAAP